jgi:hypothetical protein
MVLCKKIMCALLEQQHGLMYRVVRARRDACCLRPPTKSWASNVSASTCRHTRALTVQQPQSTTTIISSSGICNSARYAESRRREQLRAHCNCCARVQAELSTQQCAWTICERHENNQLVLQPAAGSRQHKFDSTLWGEATVVLLPAAYSLYSCTCCICYIQQPFSVLISLHHRCR